MKSASFKKPKAIEQYLKTDVKAQAIPDNMTDSGTVVKPNNGRGMGKLRKKKMGY
jgi:hypothetical protein